MTHDYRNHKRRLGHDLAYNVLPDDCLAATGWGHGLKAGDYILLSNEDSDTRYSIVKIKYYSDPTDMWQAKLQFAPRPEGDG